MSQLRINPHDYSGAVPEHDPEFVERCEATADRYFKRATANALQEWTTTMQDIEPYRGSPKWVRLRADAKRKYEQTSIPAAALYEKTLAVLKDGGEVDEQLGAEWDRLMVAPVATMEAAE